uniref:Uncharacterized protein n=1 Tax=viral metagenome TaxID=1070528 RepID=A0A2V0RAD1_9ZZZZ
MSGLLEMFRNSSLKEKKDFFEKAKSMSSEELRDEVRTFPVFGRHGGPQLMDPSYLMQGTCNELDQYIGQSFYDGPSGYTLQKFVYNDVVQAGNPTEVICTYRQDHRHVGSICGLSASSITRTVLNEDQLLTSASPPVLTTLSGRSVNASLRAGDKVIFSGIGVTDTTTDNTRNGLYSFGFVPISTAGGTLAAIQDDTADSHYDVFSAGNSATHINEYAAGGGVRIAAQSLSEGWVWQPNVNISESFNPNIAPTPGAGCLAINLSGHTGSTGADKQFQLVVYALVGPRPDMGAYTDTRSEVSKQYPLSCITQLINEKSVYIRTK